MSITLRKDLDPNLNFYYHEQFKIYDKAYLIWDRETWKEILKTCEVYRIEVNGNYAGDLIIEERRRRRTSYIVDFSLLPQYQRRGIGRYVLEKAKKRWKTLSAVTREETRDFFLKSGFILRKRLKDYYDHGVDGYYLIFSPDEDVCSKGGGQA